MSSRAARSAVLGALVAAAVGAHAQGVMPVGDLASKSPVQLSKDELTALLPGATMQRVNEKGNTHRWVNEPSGDMFVSSDNRGSFERSSTRPGRWKLTGDGRYCVDIEWRRGEIEDWCRFIFKTPDGYYAVKAMEPETQKAYRLSISR
jgi:hypothetical protein